MVPFIHRSQNMNPVQSGLLSSLIACAAATLPTHALAQTPVAQPPVRMTPYLFGSFGKAHDGVIHLATDPGQGVAASDTQSAIQLGAGMQFNELLGAEGYAQGGQRHEYLTVGGERVTQAVRAFGARVTLGVDLGERLRLFGKAGLARVIHSGRGTWNPATEGQAYSNRQTRSALGLGATYRLSEHLALRADADHVFKRRNDQDTGWGHLNHFGLGLQYTY